jgi:hypothetical protein
VNRERWTSLPAATDAERAHVASLDGVRARRELRVAGPGGAERLLGATLALEAATPFDGTADVLARIVFDGEGPLEGESLIEDAWALLDGFLREAVARAASGAAR